MQSCKNLKEHYKETLTCKYAKKSQISVIIQFVSQNAELNNITEFTIKAILIKYNIIKTKSIKIAITTNHICFNMSITSSHKNYSYLDNITHQF